MDRKKQFQFSGAYLLLAFAALLLIQGVLARRNAPKPVPMSELMESVRARRVAEVVIRDTAVVAQLKAEGEAKPERVVATRLPGIDETELVKELTDRGVKFSGVIEQESFLETFLVAWVFPIALLGGIWYLFMRRKQRSGPLSIGKAKARSFEGKDITRIRPDKAAQLGFSGTFQNIELYAGLSTLDNLMPARHIHMKQNFVTGAVYFVRAKLEEIKHRRVVEDIIDFLEIEPIRKKVVGALPYGMRKPGELRRALAMEPKVLLLDEPVAGMNLDEKEDIARFIVDIFEGQGDTYPE